jgi:hypothetical protein
MCVSTLQDFPLKEIAWSTWEQCLMFVLFASSIPNIGTYIFALVDKCTIKVAMIETILVESVKIKSMLLRMKIWNPSFN